MTDLLAEQGKEYTRKTKIKNRAKFIERLFEQFTRTFSDRTRIQDFNRLYLDSSTVLNVVISQIDDVDRVKEYHQPMVLANEHKIAAFTAKWILYLRPIQFPRELNANASEYPANRKYMHVANELFALYCMQSILKLTHLKEYDTEVVWELLYMFRYRHYTGRTLITTGMLLEKIEKLMTEDNNK
jgi:hypothetical protein